MDAASDSDDVWEQYISVICLETSSMGNDESAVVGNGSANVEIINEPSTSPIIKRTNNSNKRTNRKRKSNTTESKQEAKRKRTNKETPNTTNDEEDTQKVSTSKNIGTCPICLEPFGDKEISSTVCGHVFCTCCISKLIKPKNFCPVCRTSLTKKKVHPLFINID